MGINATRLFSILYHKTLTVGRVQTPTLKMLVDREAKISSCLLYTSLCTPDDVYICDPEAEYYPLVNRLHGQVVKLSPTSKNYVNPVSYTHL